MFLSWLKSEKNIDYLQFK